jgi:hypothetical protein
MKNAHQQPNTAVSALADTVIGSREFVAEFGDVAIDVATDSEALEKIPILSGDKERLTDMFSNIASELRIQNR